MEDNEKNTLNEPALTYGERLNVALFQTKPQAALATWPSSFLAIKAFKSVDNDFEEIAAIKSGVPMSSLSFFMEKAGLSLVEMADILHTTDRTLRRYDAHKKLNPEQSERAIELAKLYARGEDVFGNLENFKQWIDSPIMALGFKKPKEFLDTSVGIGVLMKLLGRIEHGVFS
jgi:putative toxin-antitoxin system antitoxin component (TIGR02293 family)